MKKLMATVISVLLSIASALPGPSHAQTKTAESAAPSGKADQLSFDRTSSWRIIINRDVQTQALQIPTEAKRDESQKFLLSALSAFTKGELVKINAEIIQTAKGQMLILSPATGNKMVTLQDQDGNFEGTLTNRKGIVRSVKLQKLSEKEIADSLKARATELSVYPGEDVPKQCAAFFGRWTGTWQYYGQTWLWVVEVGPNCVAKCINWSTSSVPTHFDSCEIKDNVLVRKKTDGAEYYEVHSDELYARYTFSGGSTATVFRKLKPGEN